LKNSNFANVQNHENQTKNYVLMYRSSKFVRKKFNSLNVKNRENSMQEREQ